MTFSLTDTGFGMINIQLYPGREQVKYCPLIPLTGKQECGWRTYLRYSALSVFKALTLAF